VPGGVVAKAVWFRLDVSETLCYRAFFVPVEMLDWVMPAQPWWVFAKRSPHRVLPRWRLAANSARV